MIIFDWLVGLVITLVPCYLIVVLTAGWVIYCGEGIFSFWDDGEYDPHLGQDLLDMFVPIQETYSREEEEAQYAFCAAWLIAGVFVLVTFFGWLFDWFEWTVALWEWYYGWTFDIGWIGAVITGILTFMYGGRAIRRLQKSVRNLSKKVKDHIDNGEHSE